MKYLDAGGIAITGSENVSDMVFYAAKEIILTITSKRSEIREVLSRYECTLIARGESVAEALGLDVNDPQYKFGCTLPLPQDPRYGTQLTSVAEWEHPFGSGNYKPDMGVFVHELGHAISNRHYNDLLVSCS